MNGTAQREINNFTDAWNHWASRKGGIVPAGPGLYAEILRSSAFTSYTRTTLLAALDADLKSVPKSRVTGALFNNDSRTFDVPTLGNYVLTVQYSGNWIATPWVKNQRKVTSAVTVQFAFNDRWNFTRNDNYLPWQPIANQFLAAIASGMGTQFRVVGSWQLNRTWSTIQNRY